MFEKRTIQAVTASKITFPTKKALIRWIKKNDLKTNRPHTEIIENESGFMIIEEDEAKFKKLSKWKHLNNCVWVRLGVLKSTKLLK